MSSCYDKEIVAQESVDYNQYIYSHGFTAYTDDVFIFFNNETLYFLDKELSTPVQKMCVRPSCNHITDVCSARVETLAVYASNNFIYYISRNPDGKYAVYELNLKDLKRKEIRELPLLNKPGVGFSYRIYGDYLALEVRQWSANTSTYSVYLTELKNKKAEIIPIFGGEDNTTVTYSSTELRDGWVLVQAYELETGTRSLLGYQIETGKRNTLVTEWEHSNVFSLKDNILYWFSVDSGFHSLNLLNMELINHSDFDAPSNVGIGIYDDEYLYFSNVMSSSGDNISSEIENYGIYIYTYDGELIRFIPSLGNNEGIPIFLLSTPQYTFFFEASSEVLPKWYINKSDILSKETVMLNHLG